MVFAQPRICVENDTHKLLRDFEIQTDYQISSRRPDLIIINKKERTCRIENFAVPVDHEIKFKGWKKRDKYFEVARDLKKLWNIKVTIILILISALRTESKGLVQGLEDSEITGRVETVQNTALLRSVRILRRVLETWGDLVSLKLQKKTIG